MRLYHAAEGRLLGGVCADPGEHLDIDPTVIRLVWIGVTLLSLGTGLIVYLVAWIVVPEKPVNRETTVPVMRSGGQD